MIKIDVNVEEYQVLKGAYKTLARFKPILIVEVATDRSEVFEYLEEMGYKHTILSEMKRYWDVLFLRS